MTNRYEELSDRARWFLNNFDEIDLADICAAHEKSAKTVESQLAQLRALATRWQATVRPGEQHPVAAAILNILDGAGPTVREAADNDRRWPLEKAGE